VTIGKTLQNLRLAVASFLVLTCIAMIILTLRLQTIADESGQVAGLRAEIRLQVGRIAATSRLVNNELRRDSPRADQINRLQSKLNLESDQLRKNFETLKEFGLRPPTIFPSERVENYGHVVWSIGDFTEAVDQLIAAGPDKHRYLSNSASRVNLAAVPNGKFLGEIDFLLVEIEALTTQSIRMLVMLQITALILIAALSIVLVRYAYFAQGPGMIRSYLIGTIKH